MTKRDFQNKEYMSDKPHVSWPNGSSIEVGMTLYWVPDVTFDYDMTLLRCEPIAVEVLNLTPPCYAYCVRSSCPTDGTIPCGTDRLYPTLEAAWERIADKLKPLVDDANKAMRNARERAKGGGDGRCD